uniref:Transmembrane protein 184A n=1 Tax=Kalanchoe fedtschenkoi TaxID=63787 RepID=A0A7N0U765_KALFE
MGHSTPIYLDVVAFACTVGAVSLAVLHIYRHLLNYTEPIYQRYIVRIIFMVPVYALMSFLSLILPDSSIYFNSIREVYEAWVIYNFLSLCLAWVGGPGAVVLSLSGRTLKPSWWLFTCCFTAIPLDGRFIRRCKQGCLQFVILIPILAVISLVLYTKEKFRDGNFNPSQAYLYLTIIYTISYTSALYALALFYVACRDLLQPFNPVPKFVLIKSVVFLTYWQGVLVFLAAKTELIKNTEQAAAYQNILICVEMLLAAIGHFYAFPYRVYAGTTNIGSSKDLTRNLAHAFMLNDLYHDTVHQFAPTYHDYVMYNHGEGDEEDTKQQPSTLQPTGQEMSMVVDSSNIPHSSQLPAEGLKPSSLPYDLSLTDVELSSKVPSAVQGNETVVRSQT